MDASLKTPGIRLDRRATDLATLGDAAGRSVDPTELPLPKFGETDDEVVSGPVSLKSPPIPSHGTLISVQPNKDAKSFPQTQPQPTCPPSNPSNSQTQPPAPAPAPANVEPQIAPISRKGTEPVSTTSMNSRIRIVDNRGRRPVIKWVDEVKDILGEELLVFDRSTNKWLVKGKWDIQGMGQPMCFHLAILEAD